MAKVDLQPLLEVVELLRDQRPAVRKQAVDLFLAYSTQPGIFEMIKSSRALVYLLHLFFDNTVGAGAIGTIINITTNPEAAETVIQLGAAERALDLLVKDDCGPESIEKACMLLVNLTTMESGAKSLVPQDLSEAKALKLSQAIQRYVDVPTTSTSEQDSFAYLSHVLSNITQIELGRQLLLNKEKRILPRLTKELERSSEIRRIGIAGAMKNCCFDADYHEIMLNDGLFMQSLILPLVGSDYEFREDEIETLMPAILQRWKEKDAKPEESTVVRQSLLDAIALLTSGRYGRDCLRALNVYPVLRELDLREESPDCKDTLLTVVERLVILGEEGPTDAPQLLPPESLD